MGNERKVYSVAEVNRKARMVLESGIGEVWVEGELSRVTIHSSGHWYFTLKDEAAAVSCAMFRNDNASVIFRPEDGMQVQLFCAAQRVRIVRALPTDCFGNGGSRQRQPAGAV